MTGEERSMREVQRGYTSFYESYSIYFLRILQFSYSFSAKNGRLSNRLTTTKADYKQRFLD